MDRDRLEEVCRALPIFPLPDAVLLPGMVLPLHVFEPRYRQLVEHLQTQTPLLGIATLTGEAAAEGEAPPIHRELGIGMLVGHQGLPDGRSNILVQYVGSARVVREVPSEQAFRRVEADVLVTSTPAPEAVARLRMLVLQLGGLREEAESEARALAELSDDELVDGLARRVLADSDERRAYLVADLAERIDQVQERLAEFLTVGDARAEA